MSDETIPQALYEADMLAKEQEIAGLREELALSSVGITDPSAVRSARAEYAAIPAAEDGSRPPIADVVAAWKADPESVPLTLRSILHPSGGAESKQSAGASGTGGLAGADTSGSGAGAGASASIAQLQAKVSELRANPRDEGLRAEVAKLRDAVAAQHRNQRR